MSENIFSAKLTSKYDMHKSLQPTRTMFPQFGGMTIDLRIDDQVMLVDRLVSQYPNQKYFTAKANTTKTIPKEVAPPAKAQE